MLWYRVPGRKEENVAQTVARERLELLVEKSMRLAEAGITWSTIEATQRKINAQAVQTGADPTDFT